MPWVSEPMCQGTTAGRLMYRLSHAELGVTMCVCVYLIWFECVEFDVWAAMRDVRMLTTVSRG